MKIPGFNQETLESHVASEYKSDFTIQEGPTPGRFVEYVELGKFERKKYQSEEVERVRRSIIGFELCHDRHLVGKSYKVLRLYVDIKINSRSKFNKLLMKLGDNKPVDNIIEHLGKMYILDLKNNTVGNKTYTNLWYDMEWHIKPAMVSADPADPFCTEKLPLEVKEAPEPAECRLFIFPDPTQEQYDSLDPYLKKIVEQRVREFPYDPTNPVVQQILEGFAKSDDTAADEG